MKKLLILSVLTTLVAASSGCGSCDLFRGSFWPWNKTAPTPPPVSYIQDPYCCPQPCPPPTGCDSCAPGPMMDPNLQIGPLGE